MYTMTTVAASSSSQSKERLPWAMWWGRGLVGVCEEEVGRRMFRRTSCSGWSSGVASGCAYSCCEHCGGGDRVMYEYMREKLWR